MRSRIVASLASLVIFTAAPLWAADYKIDADHSTVGFKVRHLAISSVPGRFATFDGTFSFDPANIKASKADATIALKSVDTNSTKRDEHLRGPDFFDVAKFPSMTFKSKEVEELSKDTFKLIGDLTIRGITKPVSLEVQYQGTVKDPWGNEKAGFTASAKINRRDFGLTWNKVLETGGLVVGDDVAINLEIEGTKQGTSSQG